MGSRPEGRGFHLLQSGSCFYFGAQSGVSSSNPAPP